MHKIAKLISSNFDNVLFAIFVAANNHHQPSLLAPNVLYIEDKPPKILKKSQKYKKSINKGVEKKTKLKPKKINSKNKMLKKLYSQRQCGGNVKKEFNLSAEEDPVEKCENTEPNDPLYTPQIEIKCELSESKIEQLNEEQQHLNMASNETYKNEFKGDDCDNDDESDTDYKEDIVDEEEDCKTIMFEMQDESTSEALDDEFDDDVDDGDDEPLILLCQSSRKKYKKKKKIPRLQTCLQTCKHKCTTKYTKTQRIDIFNYYWHLSKDFQIDFIRQHIRRPVLTRIRNKKRGNNCRYFLKLYKIDEMNIEKSRANSEENKNINNAIAAAAVADSIDNDEGLTKVCRKFFEGTLGISNREIKEAIEGYELKLERIVRPLRDILKEKQEAKMAEKLKTENVKKPQQFLDPETGNLTNTRPKKKTKRRKPGEPEPERFPRPINCAIRCIYKCHQNFTEAERKQICDIFWSLDFKRRKDFILARLETKDVKTPITPEFRKTNRPTRAYQSRFYLRSGLNSENKRVCKHFMMNTLCINRKFIENALQYADKTTGNYTGVDGRGKHLIHKISAERKQAILDHINSYPIWVPNKKAKVRCLHHSLSLKRMYSEYREKCSQEQIKPVSSYYYCKVFHDEFRLLFLSNRDSRKGRGFLDINPNISHYTGEEPGGCWLDSNGKPLDLRLIHPSETIRSSHLETELNCSSMESSPCQQVHQQPPTIIASLGPHQISQSLNFATATATATAAAAAAQHLANFVDTTTAVTSTSTTLSPRAIFQTTVQNLYDNSNLPPPASGGGNSGSIFRLI